MNEGVLYVRNFLNDCHRIAEQHRQSAELARLVLECKRAADAGDTKRARALLRQADLVRARIAKLSAPKRRS
jgi:hypothetical protein